MLFLLRNIRRKLLANNKVTTYLFYAIGEIVLVALGIMIAFQLEEIKEDKQKMDVSRAYLRQIQGELLEDIREINRRETFYKRRDSLIALVMNDQLTREDYINDRSLQYLISNSQIIEIDKTGYANFLGNFDQLPEDFSAINNRLKECYAWEFYITEYSQKLREAVSGFIKYRKENIPNSGSESYFETAPSDEVIDYFLNDPFYKNWVQDYQNLMWENLYPMASSFRFRAVLAYMEIQQLIDPEGSLPEEIETFFLEPDTEIYKRVAGTYQLKSDSSNTIEVTLLDEQLIIEGRKAYQLADSSFTAIGQTKFRFLGDSVTLSNPSWRTARIFNKSKR